MGFSGLKSSTTCWCFEKGSQYNKNDRVPDNKCDSTCGGNEYEICGRSNRMSLYNCKSYL